MTVEIHVQGWRWKIMGRYWMPPLYYFYHEFESSHSIELDTQESYALSSMTQNREVIIWMDENIDGIYVVDGLEDSKHAIDGMGYIVLSSILLQVNT